MAATVIIAVDNIIGVIASSLSCQVWVPSSVNSQQCTLVSVSAVAAVSADRATPRPESPEYPSPALAGDRTPLHSTPQLPAAIYLVNNIRNH